VNNEAVDEHGAPLVFYHGSSVSGIDEFDPSHSRTSYGMFFAPDPDTARFYGDNLYRVWLKIRRLANFDDPIVLRRVASEVSFEDPVRMRRTRDEELVEATAGELRKTLYALIGGAWAQSEPVRQIVGRWVAGAPGQAVDWWQALEQLEFEEPDEEDPMIISLFQEIPTLKRAYEEAHPMMQAEVALIEQAYGTDAFYLHHQDDMLRAAESLGYDGVVMTDPSSVGEPTSWVVFNSNQVCVLGVGHSPRRSG
jgi:hypothetical protein